MLVELFITCAGLRTDVLRCYGRFVWLQLKRYHLCGNVDVDVGRCGLCYWRISGNLSGAEQFPKPDEMNKKRQRLDWDFLRHRGEVSPTQTHKERSANKRSWNKVFSRSIYDMSRMTKSTWTLLEQKPTKWKTESWIVASQSGTTIHTRTQANSWAICLRCVSILSLNIWIRVPFEIWMYRWTKRHTHTQWECIQCVRCAALLQRPLPNANSCK